MPLRRHVSPPVLPLTEDDARELLAKPLLSLCQRHGPTKVGLTIGCNEKTVRAARDEKHSLKLHSSANLLLADGEALEPILNHFHRRSVPIGDITVDVAAIPCEVAQSLPQLIDLFRDGDCSDADVRALDEAGTIDILGRVADMLRDRRAGLGAKLRVAA